MKTPNNRFRKGLISAALRATLALALLAQAAAPAAAASRIKDIIDFEGVRDNQLVGYGLVVGLNNTGDTLADGHFTKQSLQAMLNRLGVKPTDAGLNSENVAAVMITANLPPFARQGSRIDVTVSALGDSSSLLGVTRSVPPSRLELSPRALTARYTPLPRARSRSAGSRPRATRKR